MCSRRVCYFLLLSLTAWRKSTWSEEMKSGAALCLSAVCDKEHWRLRCEIKLRQKISSDDDGTSFRSLLLHTSICHLKHLSFGWVRSVCPQMWNILRLEQHQVLISHPALTNGGEEKKKWLFFFYFIVLVLDQICNTQPGWFVLMLNTPLFPHIVYTVDIWI